METLIAYTHITASVMGLITSTIVLVAAKGTQFHRKTGYVFAVVMLIINISALMMYRLTGKFNFLHIFAIISLASLIRGMLPAMRRNSANWLRTHITGMVGAALGVWAAGIAELITRVLRHHLTPTLTITLAVAVGIIFFFVILYLNIKYIKKMDSYRTS
ncbi:MAG: DUF2306 domain-containing protein [Spirosomaceae bacterium]|jgi:uncharacterized membrane protein|nr:DUF2306 domain-containing protein [Spirosomataceae bacterium]